MLYKITTWKSITPRETKWYQGIEKCLNAEYFVYIKNFSDDNKYINILKYIVVFIKSEDLFVFW